MIDHPSHKTRFSDSSFYDEVCVNCGATDGRGDDRLTKPCPTAPDPDTTLRDAAENATAGVARQRVMELAATQMDLTLAQWIDISNDILRAASELDTARAEIERLRHDNEMLTTGGIIEVAVRNPSVADYMNHWEGRVEVAESILTAAQERIAEMEGALGSVEREYVTEYAGRSYTRCTCCHVALSDGQPHLTNCAWTTLSPAVKEPK